ncbi:MAG: PaaI family thioesterase [Silicimonas sp.]|nr:PaaI family thioesterase [Silicimonas sp.]
MQDIPPDTDARRDFARRFIQALPHCGALNMGVEEVGEGYAILSMPWDDRLVGDPATGVIHGGAVSTLMDTCGGTAVMTHPKGPKTTATLDLRIDYMRAAEPGKAISAKATCYHMTRTVAFVRAVASDGDFDNPVATAAGAFAVTT